MGAADDREIREQTPRACFPSSLPLTLSSCSWRWDFPDRSHPVTVNAASVLGALGWGGGDILIFCIPLPRALWSSACLQAPLPAVAILSGQIASCHCPAVCFVGSGPGRWSENLGTADFTYFSVSYKRIFSILWIPWFVRDISFPNLRSSLTFLLSFFFLPLLHCCLNDESSRKESNISS